MLPPIDVVCKTCRERLWSIKNVDARLLQPAYPFPVYSLFTWTEQSDSLLSPLIHSLKGGWAPSVVDGFAGWFTFERMRGKKVEVDAIVPAPSLGFDHAKAWGEALSKAIGGPIMDVLQKAPDQVRSQRRLSAEERSELRFQVKVPQIAYRGPLVFADDVITTGSTAMAAYMALEDPKHFEVWTMVNRPRLAASKGL